jgi:hypothetical protein
MRDNPIGGTAALGFHQTIKLTKFGKAENPKRSFRKRRGKLAEKFTSTEKNNEGLRKDNECLKKKN